MDWKGYRLKLIDTPCHVDFNYDVSRSLAACEGAILLVDCTQGVQAQTVANALLAIEGGLEIVPALNKIDMQTAQIDESLEEMEHTLSIRRGAVFKISGKTDVRVGHTITAAGPISKDVKPLPGYKEPLPVVFCGFYPTGDTDYDGLKKALERLSLNDSSFKWQAETSEALGFGFRCGFLGLLH